MSASRVDELLTYIFGQEKTGALAQEFAGWARESRRYKSFAETYKDKIRRKYRLVQDEGGLKDLRCELETAALFLNEAFFSARGFASAADFLRQYRNLSGIMLRQSDGSAIWLNPLAKHRLPPDSQLTLQRPPT